MNHIQLEEQVKKLVAELASYKIEDLSLETRLNTDLKMDGDDAIEFFDAFSEKFVVDLSDFQYNKHFGSEGGGNPINFLISILFHEYDTQEPVTIQDLVDAAKAGRWVKKY
jgi:acyl carrier protein